MRIDTEVQRVLQQVLQIPEQVVQWLVQDQGLAEFHDYATLRRENVENLQTSYERVEPGVWKMGITSKLSMFLEWLKSYYQEFGHTPSEGYITMDILLSTPAPDTFQSNQYPMSPDSFNSPKQGKRSTMTFTSTGSVSGRRNVKISITEYPKFSGKAKDWIHFERKFSSVASSQGLGYIILEEEPKLLTREEKMQYELDNTFIYDALHNCWAEGTNFHLVQKHQVEKDGRKVYLGAQKYFRGTAIEDSLIMECVAELVNTKLTPNTMNGAEGYNNAFNDNLNTLTRLNVKLDDKLTKCLYLSNITDKAYDTIKDQPQLTKTFDEIQTHILRKYINSKGERRSGAPKYYARRSVHLADTSGEEVIAPEEEYPEQDPITLLHTTKSGFPMIPDDLYQALSQEVKDVLKQQTIYYRDKLKRASPSNGKAKPPLAPKHHEKALTSDLEPDIHADLQLTVKNTHLNRYKTPFSNFCPTGTPL